MTLSNPNSFSPVPRGLWHTQESARILEILHTREEGLRPEEAALRLKSVGPNALPETQKSRSIFRIFLEQFKSPLIYLLLGADAVVFWLREFVDAYIVLFILLFNAVLGTIQEGRAERTLAALKQFVTTDAEVIREGKRLTIHDTQVVPGDIITLQEGGKIPADARVLSARNLTTDESALTGESTPVRKTADTLSSATLSIAEQRNMVFKGTTIAVGYGTAVVVSTGVNTAIGALSTRLTELNTEIPLTKNLRDLARVVVLLVGILVTILFAVGLLEGAHPKEMFIAAVAIAVAAVPEGLPLVLTVVLATGVWRMAKRRVLVKKLQAVEALGQAHVIAVDKTGTITKNELTLRTVLIGTSRYDIEGTGYAPTPLIASPSEDLLRAARIAELCSNAHVSFSEETQAYHIVGDPTEGAMEVFAEKAGIQEDAFLQEYPLLQDWPFDYEKKYHVALYRHKESVGLAITGAPEVILGLASSEWQEGKDIPFTPQLKQEAEKRFIALSSGGMRVIAFGWNDHVTPDTTPDHLPSITFGGFFVMQDPLREHIREQVTSARDAGLQVIMITGDHQTTACTIAKEAGIFNEGDTVLTGEMLDTLSEEAFAGVLPRATVFARVTPEHKVRIIQAFRAQKKIVAMTGDGINDAPSLVAADLGIAMGKIGTEVTKEAADLVLMDDNFGDIINAVEEGRNLREGLRRTITYLFSSNLGEVIVIALALFFDLPLPLIAAQIIWMNLVTDTFFDISLGMEPKDPALMRRRHRIAATLVDRTIVTRLILIATVMGGSMFFFFKTHLGDLPLARTMVLTGLVFFQWLNAWNCRSETKSIFSLSPFSNPFLLATFVWVLFLQGIALYAPFMQSILRTVPLSFPQVISLFSIALLGVLVEELRKWITRRRDIVV